MTKKLLLVLGIIFLLRIPSFFEPYWYGDEGIYLVLGQAMQRGAVLYRDIWDNKPPLLYMIYAVIPTLLWAKITATIFVLGTCVGVYAFVKKIWPVIAVGILMSLPYPILEGSIANAELYFTLPIMIGAYLLSKDKFNSVVVGLLFSAAFLLKIPAVFDFLGLFLAWFVINKKIKPFFGIAITFVLTLVPFVLYFYFNHALPDFLIASFSQNASYVAVGSGTFSKLSNPLFVKAFILFIALFFLFVFYKKKKITTEILLLSFWFGFSLYGALLSNRPYPHYLLQIVPPGILLLSGLTLNFRKNFIFILIFAVILYKNLSFFGQFQALSPNYYVNFFDYISQRKSWAEYVNFFDPGTLNNYKIADYLNEPARNASHSDAGGPIFVWGDASFVYVLSNRPPATKFIQAHHLTTINPKNYDLIIERLEKYQPKFIIVSRPPHFAFQKLEDLIVKNYVFDRSFDNLYVYKNNKVLNPPRFDLQY